MTETCTLTPISWLDLERYALEEMAPAERDAVAEHLASCDACRACLDHLGRSEPMSLPALPEPPGAPWWRRGWTWPALGAAAVAAAVILLLVVRESPGPELAGALPPARVAVKGGDLAIEMVREAGAPDVYVTGDRFKVLVTCPPGFGLHVDVVVFQDGDAFLPIPRAPIECGNRVPVPGAFRLTGESPVFVCAAIDQPELELATLREQRGAALDDDTVCTLIEPARSQKR